MKNKSHRIVYFGDSITYGLGHNHKGVEPNKIWTALIDKKLQEHESSGLFFYTSNQGINGDTTRIALERLNDVTSFRPNMVTIQFGYNDCNYWVSDNGFCRVNSISFKHNLIEIIDKLLASGVKNILLITNYLMPIDKFMMNGQTWNKNIIVYNELIREVSEIKNLPISDIEISFGKQDKTYFLDENGKWLHLSVLGHERFSKNILSDILKILHIK